MHVFILHLEIGKKCCLQIKQPAIAEQNLDDNYRFGRNLGRIPLKLVILDGQNRSFWTTYFLFAYSLLSVLLKLLANILNY